MHVVAYLMQRIGIPHGFLGLVCDLSERGFEMGVGLLGGGGGKSKEI